MADRDSGKPKKPKKPAPYGSIPVRAAGDVRLSGIHFRLLIAIAAHDRLSLRRGEGQGCWASHKTLAELCHCNYNNLSSAVAELGEWGYLQRTPHALNKRQHVYRVIYDTSPIDEQLQPQSRNDSSPKTEKSASIVRPEKNESQQYQSVEGVEYIPLKREDILQKHEKNSPEGAPIKIGDGLRKQDANRNDGAFLAQVERELKAGEGILDAVTEREIGRVMDRHDHSDPLYHQAERILIEHGSPL